MEFEIFYKEERRGKNFEMGVTYDSNHYDGRVMAEWTEPNTKYVYT